VGPGAPPRREATDSNRVRRVLTHLLEHDHARRRLIAPREVTQDGIAARTAIDRPNVSRTLSALIERGFVQERVAPIEGGEAYRKAYFLTDAGEAHTRGLPGAASARATFPERLPWPDLVVGRDQELKLIGAWMEGAGPELFFVTGMAGIGKTTLLLRAVERAPAGMAAFYFRFSPWSSLGALLRDLAGFLAAQGRENLSAYLASTTASAAAPDPAQAVFVLRRDLAGLRALLVFDDYQDGSEESELLVRALVESLPGVGPRILVGSRVARLPLDARAEASGRVAAVKLEGLGAQAIGEMLKRGRKTPVTDDEAHRLHRVSGGNPLVAQLLRGASEAGKADEVREYLRRELLDRLGPEERAVLARLAVRHGDAGPEALDLPREGTAVAALVARGLLSTRGQDHSIHDYLRDLVLSAFSRDEIAKAHSDAADACSSHAGPAAELERAEHLAAAGRTGEALKLLRERGDALLGQGFARELSRLLGRMGHGDPDGPLILLRADCLAAFGEVKPAADCYERASRLDDLDAAARAASGLAVCVRSLGELERGRKVLRTVLDRVAAKPRTAVPRARRLSLERDLALLDVLAGGSRARIRDVAKCLAAVRRLGEPLLTARTEHSLGVALGRTGDDRGAIEHLGRAAELFRRLGLKGELVAVLCNLGIGLTAAGRFREGIEALGEASAAATELGDRDALASAYANVGLAKLAQGKPDEAASYAGMALELARESGSNRSAANAAVLEAESFLRMGRADEGARSLERARRLAGGAEDPWISIALLRVEFLAKIVAGDLDEGERRLEEAEGLARKLGVRELEAEVKLPRVELTEARGEHARVAAICSEALSRKWGRLIEAPDRAILMESHGRALLTLGRAAAARKRLRKAEACYGRIGAVGRAARCRALLESLGARSAGSRARRGGAGLLALFVVQDSGRVMAEHRRSVRAGAGGEGESDAGGAVAIVQALLRDPVSKRRGPEVRSVGLGRRSLVLEPGPGFALVAEIAGREDEKVRRTLEEAAREIAPLVAAGDKAGGPDPDRESRVRRVLREIASR
jgi:tetratricopeptide (TPR) repeat protein